MNYLFLTLLLVFQTSAQASEILVEAIGGSDSTLTHAGKSREMKVNDALVAADKIQIGKKAAVDLRFQDNTLVRAGAGTSFEIKGASLYLLSGSLRVLVPEQKSNGKSKTIRFQLSTPEGSVGVRGTEFITDRMNSATTVHTLRGEVLFGPSSDFSNLAKFSVVMKGFESTLKQGESKPSTPKKFTIDSYLPGANLQNFSSLITREAGMQQPRSAAIAEKESSLPIADKSATPNKVANPPKSSASEASLPQQNPNDLLLNAAATGNVVQLQAALQAGADPKVAVMPGTGDTILHVAAVSEHLEAVQYILDMVHIPVDYPNRKGQTALMEAANEANSQDIVLLLLQNKASRLLKDPGGRNALDYARGNPNNKNIFSLLQSYSP